MFEIIEKDEEAGTIIKVFGVGGAGGNAIEHMIREGVSGVEFIAANTDAQALSRNAASSKLSLGKTVSAPAPSRKLARLPPMRTAKKFALRSKAPTWLSSPPAWAVARVPAQPRSSPKSRAKWVS